ncbi:SDR family oxidoreductase [Candidatus Pelagibacter sp.]|nr:SDR family oxidoreductase [Candidatus Pelagibacter sp.]
MKDLQNKTVLLTGCNRGIGYTILEKLAEHKCNIIACTRNENEKFTKKIDKLRSKFSSKIKNYYFDLESFESIKNSVKKILVENEKIDILINTAGILHNSLFLMSTTSEIQKILNVNFTSQILLTQLIAKKMVLKKSGNIIFFSSSSAKENNFGRSIYSASKSAIESMSKSLSKELGRYNIRVNTIAPGPVETEMFSKFTDEENTKKIINRTASKKIAKTDDIANLVIFLSSNLSSHINGQIINIDGGLGINE